MKKLLAIIVVIITITTAAAFAAEYPTTFKVYELDYTNDIVTFISFNGDLFDCYGCEDWWIDDCASVIMEDNGTPYIIDDEIVMVQYCAWNIEGWGEGWE